MPVIDPGEFPRPINNNHYHPYHEWFDGKPRRLVKGDDFTCQVSTLREAVRNAAMKRGLQVNYRVVRKDPKGGGKDCLYVQLVETVR